MTSDQRFEPGDPVFIRPGSLHAPIREFWPYQQIPQVQKGRPATFLRYMAGEQYAIVAAEEFDRLRPARDVRVQVADLRSA